MRMWVSDRHSSSRQTRPVRPRSLGPIQRGRCRHGGHLFRWRLRVSANGCRPSLAAGAAAFSRTMSRAKGCRSAGPSPGPRHAAANSKKQGLKCSTSGEARQTAKTHPWITDDDRSVLQRPILRLILRLKAPHTQLSGAARGLIHTYNVASHAKYGQRWA